MSFPMTGNEILQNYREAKNQREQIGILADLNVCSKREIAQFLVQCGETVDKRFLQDGIRKKKEPKPKAEEKVWPVPEPTVDPEEIAEEIPELCRVEPPKIMTAGVMAALLAKVDPDAPVRMNGTGTVYELHVSVWYDASGALGETLIELEGA